MLRTLILTSVPKIILVLYTDYTKCDAKQSTKVCFKTLLMGEALSGARGGAMVYEEFTFGFCVLAMS